MESSVAWAARLMGRVMCSSGLVVYSVGNVLSEGVGIEVNVSENRSCPPYDASVELKAEIVGVEVFMLA